LVVTDTVFSMDGDAAPVAALADMCVRHHALLVLDEAHAVLGPDTHLEGVDHLRVGTLSKYLGSLGGFVAGPQRFVDLLVNRARPFIFTTASTPADAAAGLAALEVLRSDEGAALVDQLRANVDLVAPGHASPILLVMMGDEEAAMAASAALGTRGLLVPAIRPPTVAPGTSRLRISLSATHSADQIGRLLEGLGALQGAT
jgi:7-keto-8-aminopelargonate synthetase-like enzyme